MKRAIALTLMMTIIFACLPAVSLAAKQMEDDVPVWTEETVRQYALDYIEGKSMSRLWGYYDLQIRRYMPMETYEAMLTDLEWMTGAFLELGSYRSFEEPENKLKTHVLHLIMEKQDLDMYFTHKDKEDDWEIMALEFVPAEKEELSDGSDMLVGGRATAEPDYEETDVTVGQAPYVLEGVLTMPKEASEETPVPVCVFVHDFGAFDHDLTMGQTTFFADLADALGKMGVASLRYDSRAYAYPDAQAETVYDEAVEDALAACQLLKDNPLVDQERIVLVGLGFGGMIAPRIVSQSEGAFTAMIILGSTPKTLIEWYCATQPEAYGALGEETQGTIEKMIRKVSSVSEEEARALTLFGKNGYYFWEDLHYNAVDLIKELKVPTYIGQGRRDPIVSEDDGRIAYADAIGDNMTFMSFKAFRGLNHILMNDLTVNEDGLPEYAVATHIDTQAGRTLAQWVLNLFMTEEE
ncbi:MAG TPA: alpha/beta hydrolase [Candidatus Limiplasma pullistercoris]|nr:alpha/beta hydrolase [Candidatus Limiplasma pullistercoris]